MKNDKSRCWSLSIGTVLGIFIILYFIRCSVEYPFDADNFMGIRCGEALWKAGALIAKDPFSWVPDGLKPPWVNSQWLSYLILYLVHGISGFTGILVLKTIVYGGGYLFLFLYARRKYGLLPALVALLAGFYVGRWFLSPRAMMYTAFFFPMLMFLMLKIQEQSIRPYHYAVLPLMFLLWSCLHGGSFIGLFLMGLSLLITMISEMWSSKTGRMAIFLRHLLLFSLCIAATVLIAPYGLLMISFMGDFLGRSIHHTIPELTSPLLRLRFNAHFFLITLAAVAGLIAVFIKTRKTPGALEIFFFIFWLAGSLKAVRNMQIYGIAAIPLFAFVIGSIPLFFDKARLQEISRRLSGNLQRIYDLAKLVALVLIIVSFTVKMIEIFPSEEAMARPYSYPGLRAFLNDNDLPRDIHCRELLGDYLIYSVYPRCRVSLDGRLGLAYGVQYMREFYDSMNDRSLLKAFLDKFGIDLIACEPYYDYLGDDPGWVLVYKAEGISLYLRNSEKYSGLIRKFNEDLLSYPDTTEVNFFLYKHCAEKKNYPSAKKYLLRLLVASPDEKILWEHLQILNSKLGIPSK
jgi:hypothetical protein